MLKRERSERFYFLVWEYSRSNDRAIIDTIASTDWLSKFSEMGPEEMTTAFTNEIYSIVSAYIPNKVIKFNDKDPPWITNAVKTAIKRKKRLYKNFIRRGRSQEDWEVFKRARNDSSKLVTDAKEIYYSNLGRKLSDPTQGVKAYWAVLNRLVNKKKVMNIPPLLENGLFVTNIEQKATILNDYFVQQCSELATGSTLPTFQPRCRVLLEKVDIDRGKVLKLIRSLDSKKAHGCDDISIAMIKICDASIVEPLCLIFEKCLETGIYPSVWKKANIVPIHKKESRQNKKNYRPISLLPIFGKIFEKLLFDTLYCHLCDNNLLTQNQSGFRPGDSTINQLLAITHKIYLSFEASPSRETRAVFLDLSKAFDRVWHDGLLYKLECNGISGNVMILIRNFLSDRKQRVLLNGKSSQWASISAGVPQGSVLGPLFFLVYINDLVENVDSDVKMFADDTSLFSVVYDEATTAQQLNRDLERVRLWAWQWKMEFNATKTEEVIFSAKRIKPHHPNLFLGDTEVERKSEHKHLGLILDSKLNFQSHIREAIMKARRGIGIIRYLSRYVSRDVLDQVYKLYVRPHLDYGDIIYHRFDPNMSLDLTRKIEQTQYSAALAVTGAWRGTNRQRLYEELGWENLYKRRWYRRLCHFYNLKMSSTPQYLFEEIPPERDISYNLRPARAYDPIIPRTVRFSNTYFQNVLYEWNLLDYEIKNSASLGEFKRKVLAIIRPSRNPIFNVDDITGIKRLTKLRVKFSDLNEHKFRHNFDCLSPICDCGKANEDNEHFLLHCPLYDIIRQDLFGQLENILDFNVSDMNSKSLCNLLLFGKPDLDVSVNKLIIEETLRFIENTKRL